MATQQSSTEIRTVSAASGVDATVEASQLIAEVKAKIKAQKLATQSLDAPNPETQQEAAQTIEESTSRNSSRLRNSKPLNLVAPYLLEANTRLAVHSSAIHSSAVHSSAVHSQYVSERSIPYDQPSASFSVAADVLNVRQKAAEGYFQAIAYWLNEKLIPQGVYAKVLTDESIGRIKIIVEFEREPRRERLVRFVCDRIYQLNSDAIKGVNIIARTIGAAKINWKQAVRIPTATERKLKSHKIKAHKTKAHKIKAHKERPSTGVGQPSAKQSHQNLQTSSNQTSSNQTSSNQASSNQTSSPQIHSKRGIQHKIRRQFGFLRAALVCGSAFVAVVFGSLFYLVLSEKLATYATQPSTQTTPWYGQTNEPDIFQPAYSRRATSQQATAISFRPASRFPNRTVEAALETVAVIPHQTVADPSDPTVTLLFGGELAFSDFVFKDAADLDNLFADIDLYRQADIAMVGLAEPLAHASTSLQEDFHRRTRPQASSALKASGIDIVGLASDGSMTYGSRGLSETIRNLDKQGIYRVGAGRNQQEAHRPEILDVKGQRVAYLSYSSDALKTAEVEKAGVALDRTAERSYVKEDIQAIRNQVDWIVVNYRWGSVDQSATENEQTVNKAASTDTQLSDKPSSDQSPSVKAPQDWQKTIAREAIDAGADLVVGSHPDHIQGMEIYRDRPIAYSLGDFAFSRDPQTDSLTARETTTLKVSLRNHRMKVELLPLSLNNSRLQRTTGEQGISLLKSVRKVSQQLEQPLQFPAVLKPSPHVTDTPDPNTAPTNGTSEVWNSEPGAAVPEAPNAMPGVVEVIQVPQEPPTEAAEHYPEDHYLEDHTQPATHPMLKESDALFMNGADAEENSSETEEQPAARSANVSTDSSAAADDLSAADIETTLDAQWQDEDWQKELRDIQEDWESDALNNLSSFMPDTPNKSPNRSVEPRTEQDVTFSEPNISESETIDKLEKGISYDSELMPWQDPFQPRT